MFYMVNLLLTNTLLFRGSVRSMIQSFIILKRYSINCLIQDLVIFSNRLDNKIYTHIQQSWKQHNFKLIVHDRKIS